MKKLFVTYELALRLKEKGYNEKRIGVYLAEDNFKLEVGLINYPKELYPDAITAPLYQQIIDWFDDIHKIRIDLTHADSNGSYKFTLWKWNYDNNTGKWERIGFPFSYLDKIERTNKAIEEALKLI